jgi:hypothetical protein
MNPVEHGRLALLAALTGLALGGATVAPAAELEEAELFLELNHTAGDLGIHSSIDGGPYTRLEIEDPAGRVILLLGASGRLAKQGLTQLFLESAEPSFDELAPEEFLLRFPEGPYEIEATRGRIEYEDTAMLSHVLAAPPENIRVNDVPAAESCDAPSLPLVMEPVVIRWDRVTESHPTIGREGSVDIERYQFFVEREGVKLGVDLPPDVTEFEVPAEILALGNQFKFEIIARTTSDNNTAVESCFRLR